MKKLLRNSLIASVVAIAGATTFASQANAQSVDVDFSGKVGNTCQITKMADGKIGVMENTPSSLSSNPSESSKGQLGSVEVNCNGSGIISVSDPVAVSQDAIDLYSSGTLKGTSIHTDSDGSNSSFLTNSSTSITPNGTPQTLYVHVWTNTNGAPVPDGDYSLRSTVSITPQ